MDGMPLARSWVLVTVAVAVCSLAGCGSGAPRAAALTDSAVGAVAAEPAEERPAVRALAVLRRWDRLRAAAYAAGEPGTLRSLYSPGSWAGARDVRTLRTYADRGLVVRGLRMQVLSAELLPARPGTLRLRVEERVAGGTVTDGRAEVRLPTGRPTERVVTLVHGPQGWQLRSVRRSSESVSGAQPPAGR